MALVNVAATAFLKAAEEAFKAIGKAAFRAASPVVIEANIQKYLDVDMYFKPEELKTGGSLKIDALDVASVTAEFTIPATAKAKFQAYVSTSASFCAGSEC